RLGGAELTDEQIVQYEQKKTETKSVALYTPLPVELRYETITVEDGKLHIYRDVYDRGTNTEQNLRAALAVYGVSLDPLSAQARAGVTSGLAQRARNAAGAAAVPGHGKKGNPPAVEGGKVTRTIKGQKEVVVPIAALAGKGYPAPVDLDTGQPHKSAKPVAGGKHPKARK